jgi:hypothetical protein
MPSRFLPWATGVALSALSGCGNFPPQSEIHGLRVLAVRPEPASGTPGETVGLDLLVADGRPWVASDDGMPGDPLVPPAVQVAWLGGCHNPPSRQYFACAPALGELVAHPERALAGGLFERGTHYDLSIPDDILSSAPRLASDPVHYGVSYVFFAACAGTLSLAESAGAEFPFVCVDDTGPVGPNGFVVGFSTVYTYESDVNQNPVLTGLDFDSHSARAEPGFPPPMDSAGVVTDALDPDHPPIHCSVQNETTDCAQAAFGHSAVCSEFGTCAPLVSGCNDHCPEIRVAPGLDVTKLETAFGGSEITWASYYATRGTFSSPTRLVADRSNGLARDFSSRWHAPPAAAGHARQSARLWVTVNDQRGGATGAFFDVVIE